VGAVGKGEGERAKAGGYVPVGSSGQPLGRAVQPRGKASPDYVRKCDVHPGRANKARRGV
jgi:hypothetical protein